MNEMNTTYHMHLSHSFLFYRHKIISIIRAQILITFSIGRRNMRQMIRLFIVTFHSKARLLFAGRTANIRQICGGRKFNAFPRYIFCKRVVYNYKSNISTHLIDINTNLRPLMEMVKPADRTTSQPINQQHSEINFVIFCVYYSSDSGGYAQYYVRIICDC